MLWLNGNILFFWRFCWILLFSGESRDFWWFFLVIRGPRACLSILLVVIRNLIRRISFVIYLVSLAELPRRNEQARFTWAPLRRITSVLSSERVSLSAILSLLPTDGTYNLPLQCSWGERQTDGWQGTTVHTFLIPRYRAMGKRASTRFPLVFNTNFEHFCSINATQSCRVFVYWHPIFSAALCASSILDQHDCRSAILKLWLIISLREPMLLRELYED